MQKVAKQCEGLDNECSRVTEYVYEMMICSHIAPTTKRLHSVNKMRQQVLLRGTTRITCVALLHVPMGPVKAPLAILTPLIQAN